MSFTFVSTRLSWLNARDDCTARGLQLAIVHDAAEQAALSSLLRARFANSAWLGATDSYIDGRWHWVDGSLLAGNGGYTNWGAGQPHDTGNEDCLLMLRPHQYTWYDAGCDTTHAFACSPLSPPRPPSAPLPPLLPPRPPRAPPPALSPGGTTNYLLSTQIHSPDPGPLQWANAKAHCEGIGMHLGVVRSAADQQALLAHLSATGGLQFFWIGLQRLASGGFGWVDGTALTYTHWAANQPSGWGDCVETYAPQWQWNDVTCSGARAYPAKHVEPSSSI